MIQLAQQGTTTTTDGSLPAVEQPATTDPEANPCDPTIETCPQVAAETPAPVAEELTPVEQYEDYQHFTLFIGIALSVFAYVPILIFLYPTWYGITSEHQTILLEKHLPYIIAWAGTGILNLLMFGPWQIAWTKLFFFSSPPYSGLFHSIYNFWLEGLIASFMLYSSILTQVMWIAISYIEWGKDDEAFLVIYPILFAIIYFLYTPLVVALVLHDHQKAVLYFDNDVI
mmetsp:Transcript_25956/g.34773  ORF Transcript_25956/g.34773 Transcript_25956/m.34773 type:complete len:228 (+) Transcript_25956:55-738(+)